MAMQLSVLETIFDTLPSGIILFESDGRLVRINHKAKDLLGLDPAFQAQRLEEFPNFLRPLVLLLKENNEDISRSEVAVILPNKEEETTLGFNLKAIESGNGQTTWAFTFSDITQVLKDRITMDKIKDELGQSKKLASIGTMIAGVAHELNNPLTGISMSTSLARMNLERLKKYWDPADAEQARWNDMVDKTLQEIQKISRANDKASVLVGDLLAYSKPTQLILTPTVVNDLINDIVGAMRTNPQFSQFTFKLDTHENRLVLADRVKLEQVFYNLVKNACDATDGKGTLEIFYSDEVNAEGKPMVTVHVKDNGPGIDKTVISRIFDPFFTTKGASGVGLGLSISYRTVEQHGGLLSVESTRWVGTEFKVSLPLHEETP